MRPDSCNVLRMAQTCFSRSGGLAPISLPLFQGVRRREDVDEVTVVVMASLQNRGEFRMTDWRSVRSIERLAPERGRHANDGVQDQAAAVTAVQELYAVPICAETVSASEVSECTALRIS